MKTKVSEIVAITNYVGKGMLSVPTQKVIVTPPIECIVLCFYTVYMPASLFCYFKNTFIRKVLYQIQQNM